MDTGPMSRQTVFRFQIQTELFFAFSFQLYHIIRHQVNIPIDADDGDASLIQQPLHLHSLGLSLARVTILALLRHHTAIHHPVPRREAVGRFLIRARRLLRRELHLVRLAQAPPQLRDLTTTTASRSRPRIPK